ncbi:MAG: hypothetical protein AAGD28_23310 [Bacteroidota bacterium]
MKIIHFLLLSLIIPIISCGQIQETDSPSNKRSKTLVMTPMTNTQSGELMGHIPLPKDWRIEGNSIVGPDGIKSTDYPYQHYSFQQRRLLSLEEVVRQDLAPGIRQAGGKILGTFVIPELENYDRAYSNLLWKFGTPRNEFHALGVDCVTPDGNRSLLVFRQTISRSQFGNFWGYYVNSIEANTSVYEEAKNDYIFAICHVHPNMDQIQRYNQNEIAKSNASWAAHRSRMAANQAAFNARNQAWMESSNAISDMSMRGWRSRNAMNDKGHSATINGILEEETITDPHTGQSMQVEAGSKRYFTNGNNEYIRTDDYFYDPNADNQVNQYEWKEWIEN